MGMYRYKTPEHDYESIHASKGKMSLWCFFIEIQSYIYCHHLTVLKLCDGRLANKCIFAYSFLASVTGTITNKPIKKI